MSKKVRTPKTPSQSSPSDPVEERTPERHLAALCRVQAVARTHADRIIDEQLIAPFMAHGGAYDAALEAIIAVYPEKADEIFDGAFDAGYVLGLEVGRRLAGGVR